MKRSRIYQKAREKGERLAKNPGKAIGVVNEALRKSKNTGKGEKIEDKVPGWKERINLLGRMLKAYFKGNYTKVPRTVILKSLATFVYFIWVVDAIPDFILGLGMIDDATLIAWVLGSVNDELEEFKGWENNNE